MDPDDFNDEPEDAVGLDDLDPNNADNAFAILERDYNKLVAELEDNEALSKYVEHYSKLFDSLYNTREQAINLETENLRLHEELDLNMARLDETVKVIKSNANTMESLKTEIENSHKLIDNAHSREQAAQEIIDNLRKQITNLNSEINFKNKMAQGELEENPLVAKHRQGLEREKVKLIAEVAKLNEKLNCALDYQEELERRTSATDIRITDICNQLEETSTEVEKYKHNKEKLELELEDNRDTLARQESELENATEALQNTNKIVIKSDAKLKEQIAIAAKCFKELETWNYRFCKMRDDFNDLKYHARNVKKENDTFVKGLNLKDAEKRKLQLEFVKLIKQREQSDFRAKILTGEKIHIINDRNNWREKISILESQIQEHKRQADADKREIENQRRERDIINKNLLRQQAIGKEHMRVIKNHEADKNKLDTELESHVIEGRKQHKQISFLEKERDRLMEDALDKNKQIENCMDQLRIQKSMIYDLKKSVAEHENKVRMQQNLFDAVKADRNALQKLYHDQTADNNEMKSKIEDNQHQNVQIKDEVANKEQLLISADAKVKRIIKEMEKMKVDLENTKDHICQLKDEINERKAEEKRLHRDLTKCDRTIKDQNKSITTLMNERDVLGTQFVRGNEELFLLYQKVKILQTTLQCGETQYEQRLDDIRLLKIEIKRLRQEKSFLTKSAKSITDLKQEVFHLERDLTRERMKSKALEDELHNPMNIHRWRKLEGSDPEAFMLMQKVNVLQRRILKQGIEAAERETQFKEAQKLYMNLRQMVSKQPGSEFQSRLCNTQKALISSNNRMKCLTTELNMVEIKNKESHLYLRQANIALSNAKRKLMLEKKKRMKHVDMLRAISQETNSTVGPMKKFAGGGFSFDK